LELVPVFAGSALRNKGVQPVLDAVVDYLPSPLDVPPVEGLNPKQARKRSAAADDAKAPLAALAYKVQMDQGRKLVYVRIYSGTSRPGRTCSTSAKTATRRWPGSCACTPTSASG
jgi:elongation factor G